MIVVPRSFEFLRNSPSRKFTSLVDCIASTVFFIFEIQKCFNKYGGYTLSLNEVVGIFIIMIL